MAMIDAPICRSDQYAGRLINPVDVEWDRRHRIRDQPEPQELGKQDLVVLACFRCFLHVDGQSISSRFPLSLPPINSAIIMVSLTYTF